MLRDFPLHEAIPRVLPDGWRILKPFGDGNAYQYRNGLRVIISTAPFDDGREWMHVSVSREDRLPSWDDLKFVKATFVAADRAAYQVLPPTAKHINIHPFCLHLWVALTGSEPLPDFTGGGDSI